MKTTYSKSDKKLSEFQNCKKTHSLRVLFWSIAIQEKDQLSRKIKQRAVAARLH